MNKRNSKQSHEKWKRKCALWFGMGLPIFCDELEEGLDFLLNELSDGCLTVRPKTPNGGKVR